MGVANIALLAAGGLVEDRTRYRLAGRAMAMLACLLLPLHLWFYDAQGLVTLSQGGHLWVPALVCCLIYAGVARWLKDELFVYPVVGGVALTGLLFLADAQIGRFWEIIAPASLLVILGAVCIHVQRLFPPQRSDDDSPSLSRETFGRAFFIAGQAALAAGLCVLLAGRFAGRFYGSWFAELAWFEQPDVAVRTQAKLAALGLTALATYTYGYCWFVVQGARRWASAVLAMFAWSAVIAIDLLGVAITEQLVVGLLAVVSLSCVALDRWLAARANEYESVTVSLLGRGTAWFALVALFAQLARGIYVTSPDWLALEFGLSFAVSAGLVVAAHVAQMLFADAQRKRGDVAPLVGVGLASMAALAGVIQLLPAAATIGSGTLLSILAVVPVALLVVFYASNNLRQKNDALVATDVASLALVLLSVPAFFMSATLGLMVLYGVLAVVQAVLAARGATRQALPASVVLTLATVWQAVVVYDLELTLTFVIASVVGLVITAVDRVRSLPNGWALGQVAVVLSGVAGGLFATNRLLGGEADVQLLLTLVAQAAVAFLAAWVAAPERGRRGLLAVALFSSIMAGVTLNAVSMLTIGQRIELLTTVAGVALLVVGHVAWRSESKDHNQLDVDSLIDVSLWFGTALATVPIAIGLVAVRFVGGDMAWVAFHEVGALAIGLALVSTGALCRLRATTLGGAGLLATYLLSLVTLIQVPEKLQTTAVYLMVGGGVCFGGALLLSIYRDRLLALPRKVREGEGVFAVLKWR